MKITFILIRNKQSLISIDKSKQIPDELRQNFPTL